MTVGDYLVPMESKEGPRQVDAVPGLSLFATGIDIARLFEGNAPL